MASALGAREQLLKQGHIGRARLQPSRLLRRQVHKVGLLHAYLGVAAVELFSRVAAHRQAPIVQETGSAEAGLILCLLEHFPLLRRHHIDSVSLGLIIDLKLLHVLVLGWRWGLPELDLLMILGLCGILHSLVVNDFVLPIVQKLSCLGLLLLLLLLLTRLASLGGLWLRLLQVIGVDSWAVLRWGRRKLLNQQVLQSVLILIELILILTGHK